MAVILVIDDEAEVRASLRRVLVGAGHSVLEAADGREGLAAYKQGSTDLVLVDLLMPVKNGFTMIDELLEHDPDAKILVVSGVIEPGGDSGLAAKVARASRMIAKPFSNEQILQAVDDLLAKTN
jgi:two-component system chemotaxis response regulator CheY